MKRCLFLVLVSALGVLLVPASASAAASYHTFVGCDDLSEAPLASHVCEVGDFPGAYFESSEETEYEACVEFPNEEFLCTEAQVAEAGVLYVNSITTDQEGVHTAYWFVGEKEVGSFAWRMEAPKPPPTPPVRPVFTVVPPPPAAPVVDPSQSPVCLKAQGQVVKLKSRLGKATRRQQKAKIRKALTAARAFSKKACT
jgi:hypothetical protein